MWLDLRGDLYLSNYRSYRIKCGCKYFNSQLPLYAIRAVFFSIHNIFRLRQDSKSSTSCGNTYYTGLGYSTGNKNFSTCRRSRLQCPVFLIYSVRELNCKPQRLNLGLTLLSPIRSTGFTLVSPQAGLLAACSNKGTGSNDWVRCTFRSRTIPVEVLLHLCSPKGGSQNDHDCKFGFIAWWLCNLPAYHVAGLSSLSTGVFNQIKFPFNFYSFSGRRCTKYSKWHEFNIKYT